MNKNLAILLIVISTDLFGQQLSECGMDDNPKLTKIEAEFLNEYINDEQHKDYDLTDKKIIFVTGNSGNLLGTKSAYFKQIKSRKNDKIATWLIPLNKKEQIASGGYNAIITYWVKNLTKRRKRKIITEFRNL